MRRLDDLDRDTLLALLAAVVFVAALVWVVGI